MSLEEFPTGCLTALVTPMTEHGDLCVQSLSNLIEMQIEAGINGLVIMGTTGESITHSASERKYIIEQSLELAQGRVPIIAGVGFASTKETIDLATSCADLPVAGFMAVTPYYNTPSQEGLVAHYRQIGQAISKPLMVYNVPHRTGVDLLPESVDSLRSIDTIVAIKDSIADNRPEQHRSYNDNAEHKLQVFSGNDDAVVEYMQSGAQGVVSVLANAVPKLFVRLLQLCEAGQWLEAQEQADMIVKATRGIGQCGPNPVGVKAYLAMKGVITSSALRLPLVGASTIQLEYLATNTQGL